MEAKSFYFADRTGITERKIELIPPVVIPKEAIDTEVERLASRQRMDAANLAW